MADQSHILDRSFLQQYAWMWETNEEIIVVVLREKKRAQTFEH